MLINVSLAASGLTTMWALLLLAVGLASGLPEAIFDDCPADPEADDGDKVLRVTVLLPSAAEVEKADPHSIVYYNQLEKGFSFCSYTVYDQLSSGILLFLSFR